MIRVIGFDLDDTLYNATLLATNARIGGLNKILDCGLKFNLNEAIRLLHEVVREYGSNYSMHYNVLLERMKNHPEQYELSSKNFTVSKYVAAGVMGYHDVKVKELRPFPDVKDVLGRFNNLGYSLILISDGIAIKQYEKLIRMELLQYFKEVFISEEIGLEKPNVDFYKKCLNMTGVIPSEALYVGDRLDHDIIPAKKLGMHTVLVHRGGKYDPYKLGIDKNVISAVTDYEVTTLLDLFHAIISF